MKNDEYSESIAATIKTFLEESGRPYSFNETKGIIQSYSMIDSEIKTIMHIFDLNSDFFLSYSYFPYGTNGNRKVKSAISEFLSYANYGMVDGNFEFDPTDGDLRFKYKENCPEGNLSREKVEKCVSISTGMMVMYGPGILDIIYGKAEPNKAALKCEQNKLRLLTDAMESSKDDETNELDFDDENELLFEELYDEEEL